MGAISITGLKREFEDQQVEEEMANKVKQAAVAISHALGYT